MGIEQDADRTANRRQVLKAASGLMAAAAIGSVALNAGTNNAAAAPVATPNKPALWVEFAGLNASNLTGFEALSFQFGVGRGVSSPPVREVSAPSISEITITKRWDPFTALLLAEATSGDPIDVRITVSDSKGVLVGTLLLGDVLVSGHSLSHGGDLAAASESLSLNFVSIEVGLFGQQFAWSPI